MTPQSVRGEPHECKHCGGPIRERIGYSYCSVACFNGLKRGNRNYERRPTIAVFGGSFNPITLGHALVASWVKLTGEAHQVWFVPSLAHPFGKKSAPYEKRLAWCGDVAHALGPWCKASDIERSMYLNAPVGEGGEPIYTIDVLDRLATDHPKMTFRFVMGTDLLDDFESWKDWRRIRKDFDPITVPRTGEGAVAAGVSSTLVRSQLAAGRNVKGLVPECIRLSVEEPADPV